MKKKKKNKRLVILGAGGHGRVVADIARCQKTYKTIVFLDDALVGVTVGEVAVIGRTEDASNLAEGSDFFVAVGDNAVRERLLCALLQKELPLATLIHPSAVVARDALVAPGCAVMAGAVLGVGATLSQGCIVNTCASVDHDCRLEAFCHVAVGAHLAGSVSLGQRVLIGAGATVRDGVSIASDCVLGAGAVAARSLTERGVYVGVPARKREAGEKA